MKPATRPLATRWIAAGSSAAVLATGLFLSAPAAHAAAGDPACIQASTQLATALGATGLTETYLAQLEAVTTEAATAGANYAALVGANDPETIAAVEAAATAVLTAQLRVDTAHTTLATAQASGDPVTISAAEAEVTAAQLELDAAAAAAVELQAAYTPVASTPQIDAAEQALTQATANLQQLLGQLQLDEATATYLVTLFQGYLATCGAPALEMPISTPPAPALPVAPVEAVPVAVAPVEPAPVVVAPVEAAEPVEAAPVAAAAPVEAVPVGVNEGINLQAAVAAEHDQHPGSGLLAGLLAAGVAVSAAVFARTRRAQRRHQG